MKQRGLTLPSVRSRRLGNAVSQAYHACGEMHTCARRLVQMEHVDNHMCLVPLRHILQSAVSSPIAKVCRHSAHRDELYELHDATRGLVSGGFSFTGVVWHIHDQEPAVHCVYDEFRDHSLRTAMVSGESSEPSLTIN